MHLRAWVRVSVALGVVLVAGCGVDSVISAQYEFSDSEVHSYAVGDSLWIDADTFVGSVTYTQGRPDSVRVTITKWADREGDLELLEVETAQLGDEIQLHASNPENLDDVAVDIEMVGPPGAALNLATGVGAVDCTGQPGPRWVADVGVGDIEFAVPADVNVSVELATGVGRVSVDFDVDGEVSTRLVVGIIGTGDEGDLAAHAGVGDISLVRR